MNLVNHIASDFEHQRTGLIRSWNSHFGVYRNAYGGFVVTVNHICFKCLCACHPHTDNVECDTVPHDQVDRAFKGYPHHSSNRYSHHDDRPDEHSNTIDAGHLLSPAN